MVNNIKKKNNFRETNFLLKHIYSNKDHENIKEIIFKDYFAARNFAKKIIHKNGSSKPELFLAQLNGHDSFKEIAPDHWVTDKESIIISSIEIISGDTR